MKVLKIFSLLFLLLNSSVVLAERIKDMANIAGVRENQLIGYGLVVGLNGQNLNWFQDSNLESPQVA